MKSKKQIIFLGLLGLALVLVWLKFVDVGAIAENIKRVNLLYVGLCLVFYFLAYFMRSIRWKTILKPVYKGSFSEIWHYYMAGFLVNYLIPIRAGEIAKSLFLKSKKKINISASLPTVLVDKTFDLAPILFLFVVMPFLPIKISDTLSTLLYILLCIFLVLLGILVFSVIKERATIRIIQLCFFFLPKRARQKASDFIESFISSIKVVKMGVGGWAIVFATTLLAVVFEALYFQTIFWAFGLNISFMLVFFGYTLMNLSYVLPTPPAQIGSLELISLLIFATSFGLEKNAVSATIVFAHTITGMFIVVLGLVSLAIIGVSLSKALSFKTNEPTNIDR